MTIGKRQLDLLCNLGRPSSMLVVGDALARSLARRGCLRAFGKDGDSFYSITPSGLRALADALEAGRIKQDLPAPGSSDGGRA